MRRRPRYEEHVTDEWARLTKTLRRALELAEQQHDYPEVMRLLAAAQKDGLRLGGALENRPIEERIVRLREAGESYAAIGEAVGLLRENARQTLRRHEHALRAAARRDADGSPVTAASSVDRLDLSVSMANAFDREKIATVGQVGAPVRTEQDVSNFAGNSVNPRGS